MKDPANLWRTQGSARLCTPHGERVTERNRLSCVMEGVNSRKSNRVTPSAAHSEAAPGAGKQRLAPPPELNIGASEPRTSQHSQENRHNPE